MTAFISIQVRQASTRLEARQVIDNIADGVSALDAQVHSLPFQAITEERVAAIERNVQLLRGMAAELRAFLRAAKDAA